VCIPVSVSVWSVGDVWVKCSLDVGRVWSSLWHGTGWRLFTGQWPNEWFINLLTAYRDTGGCNFVLQQC